jgi:hypothetical protein
MLDDNHFLQYTYPTFFRLVYPFYNLYEVLKKHNNKDYLELTIFISLIYYHFTKLK